MTVDDWLRAAIADAERRHLPELKPLLETLAHATRALRDADVLAAADGDSAGEGQSPTRSDTSTP